MILRAGCLVMLCMLVGMPGVCELFEPDYFPVATQFSPVPSGKGWKGEEGALSEEVLCDTIDNIYDHGFRGIEFPTHRSSEEEAIILKYAVSKGMFITYHAGALELFGRDKPPATCVYSPEYAKAVRENAEKRLAPLKEIPNLYNVFIYQDEPFHWGPQSFGYNDEVKATFKERYGYDLPPDLDGIRDDPKKWGDVIDFRSGYFPEGWRKVYSIVKDINPDFKTILTHDSHNTFGAGYSSHSEIAIDDVFHWGGDFSDMFVFDIYPYMMFDFRFGRPAQLPKPRMSQMHYSFAQMRNLTEAYDKDLGFWVGTYSPAWFQHYFCPELEAMHWSECEMSMTAVAQGADYLLTGYKIPVDAGHWESMGKGLRLLQKAGARLLQTPKVKAKACMLWPRTQYIQMQQEYFNVGLSFELFLRAFGELDVLHEDQVTDDALNGYEIVLLFDVELLPENVAEHLVHFVEAGGMVIADCVPRLNASRKPMPIMEELFGVKDATGGRITRMGHWVPYKDIAPVWANRPENFPDESIFTTDTIKGSLLDTGLDLTVVSPRPCIATTGEVLIETGAGIPGVIYRKVQDGHVFLMNFCLQDTYFKTWEDDNRLARYQLQSLLIFMAIKAYVRPHVGSSNREIEASVRANDKEGFLFVINHETNDAETGVYLADLPFSIDTIVDLASNTPLPFRRSGKDEIELSLSVPLGEVRLCHLKPKAENEPAHFMLWQLPNQTPTQMMSYVLKTDNGKIIVIDGGNAGDAPYLANFLKELGNHVDAWFITHAHSDHLNALREILNNPGELQIKGIYGSLSSQAWMDTVGSKDEQNTLRSFNKVLEQSGRAMEELTLGQTMEVDGVRIEVLGIRNEEIRSNPVNNSSLVLRIEDDDKSILFLADLGVEGGNKLLESPLADRLHTDYVQMAHHGQAGVNEAFYQHVNPTYCLWPTPKWLWDNDNGGGKNSGPWRTLEVRAWMDKLSIKKHYVMCDGIQKIE